MTATAVPMPKPPMSTTSRRDLLQLAAAAGVAAATPAVGHANAAETSGPGDCCPIVELRQYTLRPGRREAFSALFEREFIGPQEAAGIKVIGQFRDLDDPDRFVWVRGFADMPARAAGLGAFYGGPLWKSRRNEANASINDSDNVLLLHPAWDGSAFPRARVTRGATPSRPGVIMVWLHYVDPDTLPAFTDFFHATMRPSIEALGIPVLATFVSETAENNFKGLPVREHERVVLWFSAFPSAPACDRAIATLRAAQTWREGASDPILHQLARKPEILRLAPFSQSALRA